MNELILLLLLCIFPHTLNDVLEADDTRDIEAVVESFFDNMRESNGERIKTLITDDTTLQSVRVQEGSTQRSSSDMARFIESVDNAKPGALDEKIQNLTIHKDGPMATAWMEYQFFYNGEFSHCGVNSMNLVQTSEGWKIFSIVDTRRTHDC